MCCIKEMMMIIIISEYLFFSFNAVYILTVHNSIMLTWHNTIKIITDPFHFQTRQRLQFTITKM